MVPIKTHFDGTSIAVPEELRGAPPGDVVVIFEKLPSAEEESLLWLKAQETPSPRSGRMTRMQSTTRKDHYRVGLALR